MKKYKDMSYTIRSDKRLMKRVTINNKSVSLYANSVKELYDKYQNTLYDNLRHFNFETYNFTTYANSWLKLNCSGKSEATIKEYEYILRKYLIPYFRYYEFN